MTKMISRAAYLVTCLATGLVTSLALSQCSAKPDPAPAPVKAASYRYEFAISLSPAAAASLETHKDGLIVTALYYGNPTSQTVALADPKDGTIHLNTDSLYLEGKNQLVQMTGAGVDPVRVKSITEQKPLVLLNVYSGHNQVINKHLVCTDFQDYVSVAQASRRTINCEVAG